MRFVFQAVFVVWSATGQPSDLRAFTNRVATVSNSETGTVQVQIAQSLATARRIEEIRGICIQNRRQICGKIMKVLPEGLIVDSGYSDLMRNQLNRSWLLPGTVVATRAANAVEGNQPDCLCIGLVLVTDLPKTPRVKPKPYDYVNIEAYPMGQYTYMSVGEVRRTVRKYSAQLAKSVQWMFESSEPRNGPDGRALDSQNKKP